MSCHTLCVMQKSVAEGCYEVAVSTVARDAPLLWASAYERPCIIALPKMASYELPCVFSQSNLVPKGNPSCCPEVAVTTVARDAPFDSCHASALGCCGVAALHSGTL